MDKSSDVLLSKNFFVKFNEKLRTSFSSIVGFTIILEDDAELNSIQREYIEIIKQSTTETVKLLNDILDFTRFTDDSILEYKMFDLKQCILMSMGIAVPRTIKKEINFDKGSPTIIKSDINKVKLILVNLFKNAAESLSDKRNGVIEVSIKVILSEKEDFINYLFQVKDNGKGIKDNDKKVLFDEKKLLDPNKGIEMGLLICQKLCSLMHGKIWLENSVVNLGSIFCFNLYCKRVLHSN